MGCMGRERVCIAFPKLAGQSGGGGELIAYIVFPAGEAKENRRWVGGGFHSLLGKAVLFFLASTEPLHTLTEHLVSIALTNKSQSI